MFSGEKADVPADHVTTAGLVVRTAIMGRFPCEIRVDMKLLLFVKRLDEVVQVSEDLPRDVALQAAHDLSFALAFEGAASDVGAGSRVGRHSDHDDAPERFVGDPVTARVEPFALDEPGRGVDRRAAAEMSE